ncbi:putative arsenite efflux transporter - putative protein [Phaeoacremonium minimum UCRPA7]|uniref:Citrate transporter-like domain-containing protein n=1 Tax=Phaeoacremonium minimum (strain UCR-PA7) TaxID=1286976 RepID=R8B9N1_PHAM7|nr:putative arsenite efflux transporter - putative protein [Phaeoacremonium minimum UCRPA7]EON96014.1 putative arsenite efflux transporter - putative protein [Phaeoacremonium minimum UCRPA7]
MAGDKDTIDIDLDTSKIKDWRSIITLVVFVLTNLVVLFPFHTPIPVPWWFSDAVSDTLSAVRIMPPRQKPSAQNGSANEQPGRHGRFRMLMFPMNYVTAPLIADLFLLAILAIGRKELHDGTIGANNISPIDIMAFFLTLAYIAISIDASGLIRYLAFRVLKWGGQEGHRLFFYLYAFFFALGSFIGNDPIILSGTAFLAYMTRVSSNIVHPRAWIHSQFAVANIASAILVSSNPTNLVLAGAFDIKFIHYTANMIVPVVITAIVLFPFLLYIIFLDETLIPVKINLHELPEEVRARKPVNPNIPHARGEAEGQVDNPSNDDQAKLLPLEEIMNPFLDKGGAAFGAVIMAVTLITLSVVNALSTSSGHWYVYWVTLPAAFVMLCWDVAFGWYHRHETREIARKGREAFERAKAERAERDREEAEARRTPQMLAHLPYELVPFAFAMFVLVQALVTKGWVPVFAYGWDHWVNKTGTFAGTNIGTTILLSRVIQAWTEIHAINHEPITDRTFWATVYSLALGVNYDAFSTAISASLAGLLWRDILGKKHIKVRPLEFAKVNLPIIALAMTVGCVVLVAEVYIIRDTKPYHL